MIDLCPSTCILHRIWLSIIFTSSSILFCLVFLWKEDFLRSLLLYLRFGSRQHHLLSEQYPTKWQRFLVLFPLFPPPVLGSLLCLNCIFISNLSGTATAQQPPIIILLWGKPSTAASGQSKERISVLYGTALTLTRQCCLLSCGIEPWNDEWQAHGVCRSVTDSYRGACILMNWSLIYKLIASVSYLIVVQTQRFRHFFILASS